MASKTLGKWTFEASFGLLKTSLVITGQTLLLTSVYTLQYKSDVREPPGSHGADKENQMNTSYRVGDVIEQWCFGVAESARLVRITAKYTDIKNGRAGFDGYTSNGCSVWGYDEDVHRVVFCEANRKSA